MSSGQLYVLVAAALFGMGVHGLMVAGHLLRKVLSLNLLGVAVFLMLVALGGRGGGPTDAVPQALVLTGIVVAVSATAFALALLVALYRCSGEVSLDADETDADAGLDADDGSRERPHATGTEAGDAP